MKEKFEMLLEKNEKVIWCNDINKSAYVKKNFFKIFLLGLFPPIAMIMLGVPYGWLLLLLGLFKVIPLGIGVAHFTFSVIVCLLFIIILNKNAKNTFCCITNKRIIKRSGAFTNDFKHYSLKNVGNVQVDGNIFDSKDDNPSANLVVTVKDFHTNTDGNTHNNTLIIESLNKAYEAYKILNELTEGYNESFRVKVEN